MTVVVLVARRRSSGACTSAPARCPGCRRRCCSGTAAFTALGIGITRFIPSADIGARRRQPVVLPLTFISNIWFPSDSLPTVLKDDRRRVPDQGARRRAAVRVRSPPPRRRRWTAPSLRTLAIWTVIGDLADGPLPAPAPGRGRVRRRRPGASAALTTGASGRALQGAIRGRAPLAGVAGVHPRADHRRVEQPPATAPLTGWRWPARSRSPAIYVWLVLIWIDVDAAAARLRARRRC